MTPQELVAAARNATKAEAFAAEDQALADLIMSDEMRASIYAFNLVGGGKKPQGAPDPKLARPVTRVGVVGAGLLAAQVASPVQFVQGLRTLYGAGARVFVEVGPKKALQGFAADVLGVAPADVEQLAALPDALRAAHVVIEIRREEALADQGRRQLTTRTVSEQDPFGLYPWRRATELGWIGGHRVLPAVKKAAHVPSVETMGAPSGVRGVHAAPYAAQSVGSAVPCRIAPAMQSGCSAAVNAPTSKRVSAS